MRPHDAWKNEFFSPEIKIGILGALIVSIACAVLTFSMCIIFSDSIDEQVKYQMHGAARGGVRG